MLNLAFVILFFTIPVIILMILHRAGVHLSRFSIVSLVMSFMFLQAYVGLFSLYFGLDSYRFFGNGIQDRAIVFRVFAFSAWSMLAMSVGVLVTQRVLKASTISNRITSYRTLFPIETYLVLFLGILSAAVFFLYLTKVPEIALFRSFGGTVSEVQIARSNMGNSFEGKVHWYRLFMHDGLFLCSFIIFANYLVTKKKTIFRLLLVVLIFMLAIFSAAASTEKGPIINYLVGLFLVFTVIKNHGKFSIKSIVFAGLGVVFLIPNLFVLFAGSSDYFSAFQLFFSRVVTGQISPAYWYLEMFPHVHDYLWGSSFPNPAGLLPFEPFNLTVEISNWKNPELAKLGIIGSAPTVYWAELYANFGTTGVIVIPFIVGGLLYIVQSLIDRLENSPLKIAFVVWLALHFRLLAGSSISNYFVDNVMMAMLFIILAVHLISRRGVLKLSMAQ